MIFRQFEGLFPVTVWFETAITQSMQYVFYPAAAGHSRLN